MNSEWTESPEDTLDYAVNELAIDDVCFAWAAQDLEDSVRQHYGNLDKFPEYLHRLINNLLEKGGIPYVDGVSQMMEDSNEKTAAVLANKWLMGQEDINGNGVWFCVSGNVASSLVPLCTLFAAGKPVYLAETTGCRADSPLLLTFLSKQESAELAALLPDVPLRLAAVDEPDWEAAFTPWPAPRAFKGAADFGGGADDYLAMLERQLLPQLEAELAIKPVWRGLVGFSLGGLLAAYAAYRSNMFSRLAAVSPSLWFDGWSEFASANAFRTPPQRAYFSVGDKEKNSRNPRLSCVEDNIRVTAGLWQQKGVFTCFELNSGGHVAEVVQRMARAITWLAE